MKTTITNHAIWIFNPLTSINAWFCYNLSWIHGIDDLNSKDSVFLDHAAQSESVVIVDRRNGSHHLSLLQLLVLKSDAPVRVISVVCQRALHHVQRHANHVSRSQLWPVIWTRWVAIVTCLSVVNGPAMHPIRKSFLQIRDRWPAYAYLDELPLINKDLVVVPSSLSENLSAHSGLEPIAFSRLGAQTVRVQFDLLTGLVDIPAEDSCMAYLVRASKPSGVLIMASSVSSFSSLLLIQHLLFIEAWDSRK